MSEGKVQWGNVVSRCCCTQSAIQRRN